MLETLLDTNEVANIYGIKKNTLEVWRHYGRGPRFVKVGRLVRYKPSEVEAFLNVCTVASTSDATAA